MVVVDKYAMYKVYTINLYQTGTYTNNQLRKLTSCSKSIFKILSASSIT